MTERPIIFSAAMVRAILSGKKTQTRRIIKLRKGEEIDNGCVWSGDDPYRMSWHYGKIGDRLWVRENVKAVGYTSFHGIEYLADRTLRPYPTNEQWSKLRNYAGAKERIVPSIHMPRWACRLELEITDVRVERLNDISKNDAIAEGVDSKSEFVKLWDSINSDRAPWKDNPLVWAISFKVES